ncbi:transposable element Tcb1 transposase [Trichonephila clavipes]|nr:transposable element Tcb1 transposase [Trichonephila clavipes]
MSFCEQHVRLFRGALGAEFLLMDDSARPHRANNVDEGLQSEDIIRMDWPAYSPDMNPIEHVWDMLGRRIEARQSPPTCLPNFGGHCLMSGFERFSSNSVASEKALSKKKGKKERNLLSGTIPGAKLTRNDPPGPLPLEVPGPQKAKSAATSGRSDMVVARCWQSGSQKVMYRRGGSGRPRNTNDLEIRRVANQQRR